jgi:hypothetical protein
LPALHGGDAARDGGPDRVRGERSLRGRLQRSDRHRALAAERTQIAAPLGGWPGGLSAALQSAFWQAHPEHLRAGEIVDAFGDDARRAGARVLELDGTATDLEEALPHLLDCL